MTDYVPKVWENLPSTETPLNDDGLNDLESRVQDAVDSKVDASSIGQPNGVVPLNADGEVDTATFLPSVASAAAVADETAARTAADSTLTTAVASKANQAAVDTAYSVALRGKPVRTRPVSKVIGYFGKAGHGWTTSGGAVNANDTSKPMLGTQSVTATIAPNSSAYIEKTGMPAFSIAGKVVRLVFRYTGDITTIIPYLASSNDLTNRVQRNALFVNTDPQATDILSEFAVSDFTVGNGAPNLDAITMCRIFLNAGPGGGTVSLAGIFLLDPPSALPNGAAVMSFDDTRIAHFTVARPKLAEYGFAATEYPQCSSAGFDANYMTVDQMKYLQDMHGWEIAAHAIDNAHHVDHTTQTEAWLRNHAEQIIAWNKANGFRGQGFAWPNTASNAFCQRIMQDYFPSARGGRSDSNEVSPPTRPMDLRSYNAGSYTLAQLKGFVDKAKSGRCVAHFFFHDLPVTKVTANDFARQDFLDLVDYIAAQGVPVLTQSQVIDIDIASAQRSAAVLTYAATVTPNADTSTIATVGTLTGNVTVATPTGAPTDGQRLRIRLTQDATGGRTVTWGAGYAFGTDFTAAMVPTTASAACEVEFSWHALSLKWRAIDIARGF